jgi:hypothetical protein
MTIYSPAKWTNAFDEIIPPIELAFYYVEKSALNRNVQDS